MHQRAANVPRNLDIRTLVISDHQHCFRSNTFLNQQVAVQFPRILAQADFARQIQVLPADDVVSGQHGFDE